MWYIILPIVALFIIALALFINSRHGCRAGFHNWETVQPSSRQKKLLEVLHDETWMSTQRMANVAKNHLNMVCIDCRKVDARLSRYIASLQKVRRLEEAEAELLGDDLENLELGPTLGDIFKAQRSRMSDIESNQYTMQSDIDITNNMVHRFRAEAEENLEEYKKEVQAELRNLVSFYSIYAPQAAKKYPEDTQ